MNSEIAEAFEELEEVRDFYFRTPEFNGDIYRRAKADKWSIGEVLYHCYLLLRYTRIMTQVYVPPARLLMKIGRLKPENHHAPMHNIYADDTPMKAPKIIEPDMERRYSKGELRLMLEEETDKLKELAGRLNDDEVYWIRFPDPVAMYPNIVQAVKVAKIHEAHHYNVLMKREQDT